MFDPFSVIAAVATAATAVFMYPNFLASRPTIDLCIDDVPNSTRRGSRGEQLQRDGFFAMTVTIQAATMPVVLRSIEVKDAIFPTFVKKGGEFVPTSDLSAGKKQLAISLRPNESKTLMFLVKPTIAESGTLEVVIPFSYLRPALRASCDYERTHYIGE